mmetsp:Transcript_10048/g.32277  ORF Transcript_10048/g.32277 Transcript_10048/m.32277 type:complete len:351 (+) Transcript_10048:929-1981(+)
MSPGSESARCEMGSRPQDMGLGSKAAWESPERSPKAMGGSRGRAGALPPTGPGGATGPSAGLSTSLSAGLGRCVVASFFFAFWRRARRVGSTPASAQTTAPSAPYLKRRPLVRGPRARRSARRFALWPSSAAFPFFGGAVFSSSFFFFAGVALGGRRSTTAGLGSSSSAMILRALVVAALDMSTIDPVFGSYRSFGGSSASRRREYSSTETESGRSSSTAGASSGGAAGAGSSSSPSRAAANKLEYVFRGASSASTGCRVTANRDTSAVFAAGGASAGFAAGESPRCQRSGAAALAAASSRASRSAARARCAAISASSSRRRCSLRCRASRRMYSVCDSLSSLSSSSCSS